MFRLRTKEIGFGSGENESCRLAVPFRFISSEIFGFMIRAWGLSAKSITLSTAFGTFIS
ncbi:hypothetical protein F383_29802 [Gossypium arboreum]|nr:hypothetical protein F383_29802 [Gossypium arboreum]